jgi:uncharacterized membrane protein
LLICIALIFASGNFTDNPLNGENNMQWYYAVNGQQVGPVEQDVMEALVRDGKVKPDDLVWNASMGTQWVKASTVPGLGIRREGIPGVTEPPPMVEWSDAATFVSRTANRDLMTQARDCLSGNWGLAVGVVVVGGIISMVAQFIPILGILISLVIGGPLALGIATVFLTIARSEGAEFGMLFDGFKRFATALGAYLLMLLFTLLWTLLFIVPGIIAAIAYSMTFFILRDDPTVGALDAITRSKKMMKGNKWKYFCLQWRFFGWALLCVLTLGIGFLWLQPYMMTSSARFYEDLKQGQQGA